MGDAKFVITFDILKNFHTLPNNKKIKGSYNTS
jgi:hypothetical protein